MKAYGIDAMRNKGHKYAEDDVYTKGATDTGGAEVP